MSTAELKQMIDARTFEERKWMTAYLLDQMFSVPELRQTAEELAELTRRRRDLFAGRQRISQEAQRRIGRLRKSRLNERLAVCPPPACAGGDRQTQTS